MGNCPLISVVVPVYRAEKYLSKCVESILNQTYSNLELILVDDGSPDGAPILCDQYASADQRVRVVHKKNEGAICARATGLQIARGNYCMFVDGDDWIDLETLSQCLGLAEQESSDCVMFSYIREYPEKQIENPLYPESFSYDLEKSEKYVHRRLIGPVGAELATPQRVDNLSSMCMKLFRTETARKGRIVSDRIVGTSEDTIFNIYALDGCRISYLNRCMYHYRKDNSESITTHHKADLADKWDVLYKIFQEYIESSGQESVYYPVFLNRVACGMIGLGINEVSSNTGLLDKASKLNEILSRPLYREAFSQLETSYCPAQWKLFFALCRHRLGLPLAVLLQVINYLRSRVAA